MDNPFLPAILTFGPFFLLLLAFAIFGPRKERKKVSPVYVATAFIVTLGVGIAGACVSVLLAN